MNCPLGIDGRHCEFQETTAKDILTAIAGGLVFTCTKFDKIEDCPQLKAMVEKVLPPKE